MIPLLFKVIFQMESERREDKNLMLKDSELRGQGHGAQRSSNVMPEFISSSSHPGVAAVHVILKIGIVFLYLILPLVTTTFNTLFFIIILGAVDFWIVKNVAGRLLVGLRWWIDFNEDGEEHWKFECKVDEKENSGASDKAFWWTLILFSLIWIGLSVINILKINLTHMTICIFCTVLLIFNVYSYYRCSKVQKDNVTRLLSQYGAEAAARYMRGSIISEFK